MDSLVFDIAVIGAGPGGYTAAIRAAKLGKKVVCIEKGNLGGVCLNWGCIPTKALIKSAEVYHQIKTASNFGFEINSTNIDFKKIIQRSRNIAEKQEKGIEYLFKKNKVQVVKGKAKLINNNTIAVSESEKDLLEIKADKIIITTGAKPKTLPNIIIDRDKIISSTEAMTLKEQPKDLVIIGAGAIGIEFAYIYATLGTNVTIIEALDHLLPLEDEEISKNLEREFRKKKIKYHTKSLLQDIKKTDNGVIVNFRTSKGEVKEINGDCVLMAIGVTGNIEDIGLNKIGVKTEKGFILVDKETYETNINNIYAIGDVIGPPLLAHVASHEGIACVENMFNINKPTRVNYDIIPGCTYCQPQVASLGLSEKRAVEMGYDLKIGKYSFLANGKASAIGDNTGIIKIIFNAKDNKILGCHIIGAEATELIAEISLAMSINCSAENIMHTIHAHPTLSEGIMEASANAYGESITV